MMLLTCVLSRITANVSKERHCSHRVAEAAHHQTAFKFTLAGRARYSLRAQDRSGQRPREALSAVCVGGGLGRGFGKGGKQDDERVPMAQKALTKFLELPAVPIGSYVSKPISFLHGIDARVKQAWLAALFVLPSNGVGCVLISVGTHAARAPDKLCALAPLSVVSVCMLKHLLHQNYSYSI